MHFKVLEGNTTMPLAYFFVNIPWLHPITFEIDCHIQATLRISCAWMSNL